MHYADQGNTAQKKQRTEQFTFELGSPAKTASRAKTEVHLPTSLIHLLNPVEVIMGSILTLHLLRILLSTWMTILTTKVQIKEIPRTR